VQKEVIEAYPNANLRVFVVWTAMLEDDDALAAQDASRLLTDRRVRQYFDATRLCGRTLMSELFPDCLNQVIAATPTDHPLRGTLEEWAADRSKPAPLWDAMLFYDSAAEWGAVAPRPVRWSNQVAYHGASASGAPSATFFRDTCSSPPVESDWYAEIRSAMRALLRK